MKNLLTILFTVIIFIANAQDVIVKNDKSEVKAKVLEITDSQIKYRKFEMLDGPTYNINIDEVFMIIYKNGQKEMMVSKKAEPAKVSTVQTPTSVNNNSVLRTTVNETQVTAIKEADTTNSKYRFNRGAGKFFDIGFSPQALSTPGIIIPNVFFQHDFFLGKNIAGRIGASANYSSITAFSGNFGDKSSVSSFGALLGAEYYLNELIKIPKSKASFFVGASVSYVSSTVSNDGIGSNNTASALGIAGNFGGRYHFSKKFGILAQVNFSQGGTGILAGISFLRFDGKKNKKGK